VRHTDPNVSACYDAALSADERGVVDAAQTYIRLKDNPTWCELLHVIDDATYPTRAFSHPTIEETAEMVLRDLTGVKWGDL
jgi:hypothetical protein